MKYLTGDKERATPTLIKGAVDGVYTVGYAARRLRISARQVKALKKAVREQGDVAVIHGNSGRHPANYTDEKIQERIILLKKSGDYFDTNFTYFRELLQERENIKIGYTALSGILKNAGIVSKKTHSNGGKKFKRRSRFGELLQAGAAPFDRFNPGTRLASHGFIDDAAGRIAGLYMCQNECLQGYMETLRRTISKYGIPPELYTDKAGLFFVNNRKPGNWSLDGRFAGKAPDKTQFEAIAGGLGINLVAARTPRAKGRIERARGTLRDRLVMRLKITGIKNTEQFNAAAAVMDRFNKRFAKESGSTETSFVPLDEKNNLYTLLAVKHGRTTDACGCFPFQNLEFEVVSEKAVFKKKIVFMFSERPGFRALYNKTYCPVRHPGFLNNAKRLLEVTESLLFNFYPVDGKTNPQSQAVRG